MVQGGNPRLVRAPSGAREASVSFDASPSYPVPVAPVPLVSSHDWTGNPPQNAPQPSVEWAQSDILSLLSPAPREFPITHRCIAVPAAAPAFTQQGLTVLQVDGSTRLLTPVAVVPPPGPCPAPQCVTTDPSQPRLSSFLLPRGEEADTVEPGCHSSQASDSSDGEWTPDSHITWLHLGARCAMLARPWFMCSLAEDWYRLSYLAPMCGAPLSHPACTTHSIGPTRSLIINTIPEWEILRGLLLGSRRRGLTGVLQAAFPDTTNVLPHVYDPELFWATIAKLIRSHNGPGGSHGGTQASWSPRAGFSIHAPVGGLAGFRAIPEEILWGDLHPLTSEEWSSLMSIDSSTARSVVEADCPCPMTDYVHNKGCKRQRYSLQGSMAMINARCASHYNLIPHKALGFDTGPVPMNTLHPDSWSRCTTIQFTDPMAKLTGGTELTLGYISPHYPLACFECSGDPPSSLRWGGFEGLLPPPSRAVSEEEGVELCGLVDAPSPGRGLVLRSMHLREPGVGGHVRAVHL